jgi:dienelactone hydrolase
VVARADLYDALVLQGFEDCGLGLGGFCAGAQLAVFVAAHCVDEAGLVEHQSVEDSAADIHKFRLSRYSSGHTDPTLPRQSQLLHYRSPHT